MVTHPLWSRPPGRLRWSLLATAFAAAQASKRDMGSERVRGQRVRAGSTVARAVFTGAAGPPAHASTFPRTSRSPTAEHSIAWRRLPGDAFGPVLRSGDLSSYGPRGCAEFSGDGCGTGLRACGVAHPRRIIAVPATPSRAHLADVDGEPSPPWLLHVLGFDCPAAVCAWGPQGKVQPFVRPRGPGPEPDVTVQDASPAAAAPSGAHSSPEHQHPLQRWRTFSTVSTSASRWDR